MLFSVRKKKGKKEKENKTEHGLCPLLESIQGHTDYKPKDLLRHQPSNTLKIEKRQLVKVTKRIY